MDAVAIAAAMEKAVETAYKAVMKPKEGTILTVATRSSSEGCWRLAEESAEDLETFLPVPVITHAEEDSGADTGNASCSERSRCRGLRRTGTSGSVSRVHLTDYLGKEIDYDSV